jgi:glucose-6-phosphate isomerase, archaeal
MSHVLDPFSTLIRADGSIEPQLGLVEHTISSTRAIYQAPPGDMDDRATYRVYLVPVPETSSEIQCSTTVIEPGLVGDEYFMTRGHFHRIRERSEVYLGLSGAGLLVMATESGEHRVASLRQGELAYVPGGWAHRTVNTGPEPFVFFAAYVGDAGHDYEAVAARGFPVLVVRGEDGPRVVENPRYARPRP